LHTIVMLRQVHHGPTRAYTSRRIAQGKSQREVRRCLPARHHWTRVATVRAPGRNVAVPLTSQDRGHRDP
jgi:hypothetical protein